MDKLVNHKNIYWLNEDIETPAERVIREAKEAKDAADKIIKDKADAAQKVIDDAKAKADMMAEMLKSPEFLAAVKAEAEKVKDIEIPPLVPKTESEKEIERLNKRLDAEDADKLATHKRVIADKFGLEISDLEGFTDIKALELLAPKIAAKAETTILSAGEYIKKTDTAKIKEIIESVEDDKDVEKTAKANSQKALNALLSFKRK